MRIRTDNPIVEFDESGLWDKGESLVIYARIPEFGAGVARVRVWRSPIHGVARFHGEQLQSWEDQWDGWPWVTEEDLVAFLSKEKDSP